MLQCLQGQGHMYATDVDHEEAAKTKKRLEDLGFRGGYSDLLNFRISVPLMRLPKEVRRF